MIKIPSTKIVLIKIAKKSGKYPVKLRITYNREQRFYPCNIDLTDLEYEKVFYGIKPRKAEKEIKDVALGIEAKAIDIIEKLKPFDYVKFEKKFYDIKSENGDVYDLFMRTHNELINANRIGSASLYLTAMKSLKSYQPNLSFDDITPEFLNDYENSMIENSNTLTTVGIYLRQLRAIFNIAISEGLASKDTYPFTKNKYTIPVGNNIKKALSLEEIGMIFNYETVSDGWERKAKDFWCFSYLSNGMNMMDIAQLKYKDINDGEIHYQRAKTIRTNRGKNNCLISIPILPEVEEIIKTWGNKKISDDTYIFPIITPDISSLDVKKRVKQFTKMVNTYTKKIAANLNIDKNVTTYVARHSFATVLKRSGASVEAISETLGHKNTNTTRSYLDSFESESRKKNAQALVAFKRPSQ